MTFVEEEGSDRAEEGPVSAAVAAEDDSSLDGEERSVSSTSAVWISLKLVTAAVLCFQAFSMHQQRASLIVENENHVHSHRRLEEEADGLDINLPPEAKASPISSYLTKLYKDLAKREKLFADTPPEEVKYWFEYTDPLQVSLIFIDNIHRGGVRILKQKA